MPPAPPEARTDPTTAFWYDYIDPASFLVDRILRDESTGAARSPVLWRPLEIIPPHRPPLDPADPGWLDHLRALASHAGHEGLILRPPGVIPWTRKAHELAFHAREQGCFAAIHRAIFEGYFLNGLDIGRVDVLVEVATRHGLDGTAARVVLDVDRFTTSVQEERGAAEAAGIQAIPTLQRGGAVLEGFHDRRRIREFLDTPLPL